MLFYDICEVTITFDKEALPVESQHLENSDTKIIRYE